MKENKATEKLLKRHQKLIQSDGQKVVSHVQREIDGGDWMLHTLMLEGIDVPFTFKRKKAYRSLTGARVNLTYYADSEEIAGMDFEMMRVVRIRQS